MPDGLTPFSIELGGREYPTRTCPRKLITDASWSWLRLHRFYARGLLPFAGGLLDQPNTFLESMEVIDGAETEGAVRDHGRG